MVDVTGAVRDVGVYRLPAGSRVDDAVKRAGGATPGADVEHINLAAKLTDGQQVAVPTRVSASATADAADPGAAPAAAADAPISLSSATVADLDTIEGIGPVTAQDIIDFRDQHGGIGSIDDLDQISGIGPATMEALRARLQPVRYGWPTATLAGGAAGLAAAPFAPTGSCRPLGWRCSGSPRAWSQPLASGWEGPRLARRNLRLRSPCGTGGGADAGGGDRRRRVRVALGCLGGGSRIRPRHAASIRRRSLGPSQHARWPPPRRGS